MTETKREMLKHEAQIEHWVSSCKMAIVDLMTPGQFATGVGGCRCGHAHCHQNPGVTTMKRNRSTTLPLGTISSGTLRMEDLIPAVLSELECIRLTRAERRVVQSIRKWDELYNPESCRPGETWNRDEWEDSSQDNYIELCDIAEAHCPDYCYFGGHEGDPACVGVWPVSELFESGNHHGGYDGYIGNSRDGKFPFALEVNDHGNATLYRRIGKGNRWKEVWSVV